MAVRFWPSYRLINSFKRDATEQFASESLSDYFGFPTKYPYLVARLDKKNLILDGVTGELVSNFQQLPPDLRWTFTTGLDESRFSPPDPNSRFTSTTWFHLDAQGIWLAKGGLTQIVNRFEYWVGLWNKQGQKPNVVYRGPDAHKWSPQVVTVSRDGRFAASADRFGEVHVWKTSDGKAVRRFKAANHAQIWNVQWNSDGSQLYLARKPNAGTDFATNAYGNLSEVFDFERRVILSLDNAAVAELAANDRATDDSKKIKIVKNGLIVNRDEMEYRFVEKSFGNPTCYSILNGVIDGVSNLIAVGSDAGKMVVLELAENGEARVRRRFHGHHAFVTRIDQSPDGTLLASSSIDGTIRLWSLAQLSKRLGDVDFDFRGNQVLDVPRDSESQRVGLRVGDRILKVDDVSFYESRELMTQWKFEANQKVRLQMRNKDDGTYRRDFVLQSAPTHVEPLLSLLITTSTDEQARNQWVLWSPRGYYDASPSGDSFIGWHENRGRVESAYFYKAKQFREELYRPDIVDEILKLRDADAAVKLAGEMLVPAPADLRITDKLQELAPPIVKIVGPVDGHQTQVSKLTVLADVTAQTPGQFGEIQVEVNGLSSGAETMEILDLSDERVRSISQEVTLQPGENRISVMSKAAQSSSQVAEVRVTYDAQQEKAEQSEVDLALLPMLSVLSIGISDYANDSLDDLSYAHNDAIEFSKVWRRQRGRVYGDVKITELTDSKATTANIKDAIDSLLAARPGPEDVVIILFAGHGMYDGARPNSNFYFVTHDTDPKRLRSTAIAHYEIGNLISRDLAHCKRILFVDACHGGATAKLNPWRNYGGLIFASSSWREKSMEDDNWKNGAFTQAILEAMRIPDSGTDPAKAIVSRRIRAKELDLYCSKRVEEITNGMQKPVSQWPGNLKDFFLAERVSSQVD